MCDTIFPQYTTKSLMNDLFLRFMSILKYFCKEHFTIGINIIFLHKYTKMHNTIKLVALTAI